MTWNVNIFASLGKARLPSSCVVLKVLFYYDFSGNEGPVILHSPPALRGWCTFIWLGNISAFTHWMFGFSYCRRLHNSFCLSSTRFSQLMVVLYVVWAVVLLSRVLYVVWTALNTRAQLYCCYMSLWFSLKLPKIVKSRCRWLPSEIRISEMLRCQFFLADWEMQ